jgi:hypothetical protein
MKTFLAFVLGGLLVWAVMNHHKSAPVVQADQQPVRATLHEQMECAAATERYAKQNENDPTEYSQYDHGTATLHSHYDPAKRQCVGMWDFDGFHSYISKDGSKNQWHYRSIDVFDPVENQGIAGGYWKDSENVYQAQGQPVWGLASLPAKATLTNFTSLLFDQYGVSE